MRKKILTISALIIIIDASGALAINTYQSGNIKPQVISDLTEQETKSLLYMREEEKLARDVYITFNEKWSALIIFNNIAESKQRHMDSIKRLSDKYGLDDPAEGKDIGEFTDQELQSLFYELIAEGEQSLIDALTVGGKIEEIDIIDLKNYIQQTEKLNIKSVYNNLLEGPKNHLRAFVKELKKQGITYKPFYLNQEEFDEIINGKSTKYRMQHNECSQNQLMNSGNKQLKIRQRIKNMIENILKECNGERNIFRNRYWR